MDDPKKEEGSLTSSDPFGIGMNADGTLNIIPADQVALRIAERDAREMIENAEMDDEMPVEANEDL